MNTLNIFCPSGAIRSRYIIHTLLSEFQGFHIEFSDDIQTFCQIQGAKMSYLEKSIDRIPNIFNSQTIENDEIFGISIQHFPKNDFQGVSIEHDIFAQCFFLLTGAEEYHSQHKDKHNRFPGEQSVLSKLNSLQTPVVDVYAQKLKQWLCRLYPELETSQTKPSAILTFDIDIAYAFKAKPLLRNIGAFSRDLVCLKFNTLSHRIRVLSGKEPDPFDVYQYLEQLKFQTDIPQIFFFHVRENGKYDKAANVHSKAFRNLVKYVSTFATVGIHPSYFGGQDAKQILAEKNILEDITGEKITHSRQHFLRFQYPHTAQELVKAGIEKDFTLGYASTHGWKAGTCNAFQIFDMETNSILPLKTHPIAFMDGTLKEYLHLDTTDAILTIRDILQTVMKQHGIYIPLWHNETISEQGKWKHWKTEVFEQMLEMLLQELKKDNQQKS